MHSKSLKVLGIYVVGEIRPQAAFAPQTIWPKVRRFVLDQAAAGGPFADESTRE
jgi:hypothetical protein